MHEFRNNYQHYEILSSDELFTVLQFSYYLILLFQLNNDEVYKSFMCSDFSSVSTLRVNCKTDLIHPERLKILTKKLSKEIKNFHWDFYTTEIHTADFVEILASMENLKELSIYGIKTKASTTLVGLNFPSLISISSYTNDSSVQNIILTIKARNLERFTMFTKDCNCSFNINRFLRRNRNLRKLSLYGEFSNLFSIRHQTNLQFLYIEGCLDHSNTFNAICNLRNLLFLDISMGNVPPEAISNLTKLNKLKKLVLRGEENLNETTLFGNLSLISISNLESITLEIDNISTSEDNLAKLSTNFPQLENFEIVLYENRNVYDFLEKLKAVKNLSLNFEFCEISGENLSSFFAGFQSEISSSKLKVLNLSFINFSQKQNEENNKALLKILNFLPQLGTLTIQGIQFSFNEEFLQNLINIWRNLEEIDLEFASGDCKEFEPELLLFARLCQCVEEFCFSLNITLQCKTHLEKFKENLRSFKEKDLGEVSLCYDQNFFSIKVDKRVEILA